MAAPYWSDYTDEELLKLRFSDLKIKISDTWLDDCIAQLYDELAMNGLRLKPHFWLSDEWFSPDGIPGIAVPFYLAHRRLMKLEDRQMFMVEGGNRAECMRLLRHETGHVIDTAFNLRRLKQYKKIFGRPSKPYPETYLPDPRSRRYVLHLDWWYAQSHPTEDFAETFAVWLNPYSRWRMRYKDWPALHKLHYVDELMSGLTGVNPKIKSRKSEQPLSKLKITLGEHYDEKRERYGVNAPAFYDADLKRIFSRPRNAGGEGEAAGRGRVSRSNAGKPVNAASFIRRVRPLLRSACARGTGEHPYVVEQMLQDLIQRCRELKLVLKTDVGEEQLKLELAIVLSTQVNNLHKGRHRISM